jgi:hypothetical protein
MRTFNEALEAVQKKEMPTGYSRGVKECPKCGSKTGKDDREDYGDCKCHYREKSALGTWKFERPEEPEKPAKPFVQKPDKFGMFKKER